MVVWTGEAEAAEPQGRCAGERASREAEAGGGWMRGRPVSAMDSLIQALRRLVGASPEVGERARGRSHTDGPKYHK